MHDIFHWQIVEWFQFGAVVWHRRITQLLHISVRIAAKQPHHLFSHSINWISFNFTGAMPVDIVLILAQFRCPRCKDYWKDAIIGNQYEQKCPQCCTIVTPHSWVSAAHFFMEFTKDAKLKSQSIVRRFPGSNWTSLIQIQPAIYRQTCQGYIHFGDPFRWHY